MPRISLQPALCSEEPGSSSHPHPKTGMRNPGSWGIRFESSPGVEAQEGEALLLQRTGLLLSLIVGHSTRHFVASFSPAIGRAGHTPVRFVSFPISATELAFGRCGVDKRWKGIMYNQVGTAATKHVSPIAPLSSLGETRLKGEVLVT